MMTSHRVLVIDDDARVLKYVARALSAERLEVETAPSGQSGMRLLAERPFDAVVCDLRMPDVDGLEVLDFARGLPEAPVFILLTAYGSVPQAVDACRRGAADFVEKPLRDLGDLATRIRQLLRERRSVQLADQNEPIGGEWLESALDRLAHLAVVDDPVLIWGEVGTGKGLMASELWRYSPRAAGSFCIVNCASLTQRPLAEAPWRAARYSDGVLVLEAVSELPDEWQSDLFQRLRQLEVGMDVLPLPRLVALTSTDLVKLVAEGRFRGDLFYTLSKHTLRLPPLRERRDDIPALVEYFARRFAQRSGSGVKRFTRAAIDLLVRQPWPGNVRELESLVERLCLARSQRADITRTDVLDELGHSPTHADPAPPMLTHNEEGEVVTPGGSLSEAVRRYEVALIERALEITDGNQSEAAKLLNIRRSTLSDKIRRNRERHESDDGP